MSAFHEILKQYWGYDSFRALQEDIIKSVSEGRDTLGLMPTGGGKSLTFQVPTMQMEGICIVITPLIALMKDQVDNLKQRGIKATAVHSGMNRQEIIVALENCVFGDYKFLYLSPERLTTDLFLSKLQHMNVCLLAIDESHCISQWGYDFRPSYLRISELRDYLPEVPVLALTATATPEVINDIQEKLLFKQKNVFSKSFERKNVAYIVRETEDKLSETIHILNKVPGTAIVYVRSRKRTIEIARELKNQGIIADYFHAGMNREDKIDKQNKWKSGECRVIVSTNAFGMGIDKPDVRTVIHYEMPSSLEEYFQEAGRAGRDEKKAYAIALYSARDEAKLKKRIKDEFPERDFIKDVYEKLAYLFQVGVNSGFQTTHNFHLEQFCSVFKFNMTQVHHALKLLELSGYIEYVEEPDHQSRLIFTITKDDMYKLSAFSPQTEELIQVILRSYTGLFADYVYIKEDLLASRTGLTSYQIYEILKLLSSQHIIHYIPAQKSPVISYLQNREDIQYLSIPRLAYEERKERLETRIKSVVRYTSNETTCRSRILLEYFGEKESKDCGQCDICLAKNKKGLSTSIYNKISHDIISYTKSKPYNINELLKLIDYDESHIINVIRHLSDNGIIEISNNTISYIKNIS